MNEEEKCNTTLGLGIGVGIKEDNKQSNNDQKKGFLLDLSLDLHPKIVTDIQNFYKINDDDKKDDQGSSSSKSIADQVEKERVGIKRLSVSNNVYNDNNDNGSRKKLKLTVEQTRLLEDEYSTHSTLTNGQKQELAKKLNLLPRQIEVWFQNRRARTKVKQTEKENVMLKKCCETYEDENRRLMKEEEMLKKCCETVKDEIRRLKDENRRLMKELQELRLLKRCVSCEEKKALAVINGKGEDSNKQINGKG